MFRCVRLGILTALVFSTNVTEAAERPPNVLVFFTDDHGWADLGAQGANEDIRTPHLDQLARDGVRFERGYVTAPQCVPSRAGLLTGRYQQRFGVEDNTRGPLPLDELTLAERLRSAGYRTGMSGKWHLDVIGARANAGGRTARLSKEHMPHHQGFEEYWRGELRQYWASHDLLGQPIANAPQLVSDNRFRVVSQTAAALSFLDRRSLESERPWFLYVSWFAPHVPLESPEPWFSAVPENLPIERRQALAMIAAMDDGLGRIRARLKDMNQEQNTLIFFIGDNGAPLKEGAWNGSLNEPLTGEKGMLTDGGLRVPFVAAWPGTIPPGQVFPHPVSSLDVAATAVSIAGQSTQDLDGINLLPFLTEQNDTPPHEALFWRWRSQAAVLQHPWKLIRLGKDKRYLFDVTGPELASRNQLETQPEIARDLEAKLDAWTQGLKPPGAAEPQNSQDELFYQVHVERMIDTVRSGK
jgi:arylsulfatase A-like enzyme